MSSYDIYLFHYYSLEGLFNRLSDLNVSIKKYYVYNKDFYLKIHRKYRKLIRENFNDCIIVDKVGFVNEVEKLFLKPTILISLLISISLFINLSTRIYDINIEGDYPGIEDRLISYLNTNGISKFNKGITTRKLKDITYMAKEEFNNELEFLEIVKEGATVTINYKRRRKALKIEGKKGSLYASKDGVIRGFALQSGVKIVKLYNFVKKGDLLVSDILITSDNKDIIVGTIGSVYASTFYYVEVSCSSLDPASTQACLLDKARYEVSKNINSKDEYIESESILINDLTNGYLKAYYVLYEDITI